jgi:tetratricopeptide (TPR) repeat protein
MKLFTVALVGLLFLAAPSAAKAQEPQPPAARVVDLKSTDGTILKATFFAAATPGPGVVLFHQNDRTRDSWAEVARQLAAAGISALTLDNRGFGESGGKQRDHSNWSGDLDTAFQYLASQPGVKRDVIGVGGAGGLGVDNAVEEARRHATDVKSLVLLSGETLKPQMQFLRQAWQLPGLFVADDLDEYQPGPEETEWLYDISSNSGRKLVHYSAKENAPWLWYEPFDIGKVPATGHHGTDMFQTHSELPGIIVAWFTQTLIKTPGHAPADTLACADILRQIDSPGGAARVTQQLLAARQKDPQAQLFPEVVVDSMAARYLDKGATEEDKKTATDIYKLNLLAYPDSADAHENLAEAYLAAGQKDLARRYAEKALAMIDSHKAPLSSWSDTEQRRAEIRRAAQDVLKKLNAAP